MKKQRLTERFQELAGIKPLYEMPKRFHGTAQDRRDEFDPFAHVGSEEEFYTQIQRDMKDIYDLDVPMEEIKKWVAGYHFPYSSWDHEKDEPGPKVLAWETEERIDFIEYLRDKGLAPRPGPESDPPQNYQDAVKSGKYKDMGGNPLKEGAIKLGYLKESSISRLKDKVKDMSKEDFTALVKKVGDLDKWKNASKGKFDDGTPIKPFSNASDRIEVIDNNFEEKDAEKYLEESMDNHPGSQNIDPEYRDTELDILGTDNRDISTTRLNLSGGNYIEVNPVELMGNAIENTDNPTLMQQFQVLVKSL